LRVPRSRRRDHAAIGDDADAADGEASLQTVDCRQQGCDIGGIAQPHLGADRPSRPIDDQRQDHLLQIGSVILGIAMLAQRLAAFAIERKTGRIHEHGGEIGEEIAHAFAPPAAK